MHAHHDGTLPKYLDGINGRGDVASRQCRHGKVWRSRVIYSLLSLVVAIYVLLCLISTARPIVLA
jgi:hypothetical protein